VGPADDDTEDILARPRPASTVGEFGVRWFEKDRSQVVDHGAPNADQSAPQLSN